MGEGERGATRQSGQALQMLGPIIVVMDHSGTYQPVLEEILAKEILGSSWRDKIHREAFLLNCQCVSVLRPLSPMKSRRVSEGERLQDFSRVN